MCHNPEPVDERRTVVAGCARMVPMPKFVDYPGRFAFFEEASFVVVRDHGVSHLSRHRIAKVLGTSISTVRRTLAGHADLRALALREVEQRRRAGRYGRPRGEGPDAAANLLRRLLPDETERIAEELVWWRLVLAAPPSVVVPRDPADLEEGPLHHRFAVGSFGYVPHDILALQIEPPAAAEDDTGQPDRVVAALLEREEGMTAMVDAALTLAAPDLAQESLQVEKPLLLSLLDGLGIRVCLGRTTPEEAVAVLRDQLVRIGSM